MRFEFVRTDEHGMSAKKACRALGVSRGGYYAHLNRPKSSRQIARAALEPFAEDIFYANNRRYGSRQIVVELRKIGIVANGKTVQRMMARKGPVSCRGHRKHRRGGKASDKETDVLNRDNPEEGLMVHTNRSSQYTSSRFRRELEARVRPIVFPQGLPLRQRRHESFFKAPRRELPLDRKYDNRIEARQKYQVIELYCNTRRPHSSFGNLSPVEYERQCAR